MSTPTEGEGTMTRTDILVTAAYWASNWPHWPFLWYSESWVPFQTVRHLNVFITHYLGIGPVEIDWITFGHTP